MNKKANYFQHVNPISIFGADDAEGYKAMVQDNDQFFNRHVNPMHMHSAMSENLDYLGFSGKLSEAFPMRGCGAADGSANAMTTLFGKRDVSIGDYVRMVRQSDDRKLEVLFQAVCPEYYSTQHITNHLQRGMFEPYASYVGFITQGGSKCISPRTTLLREKFERFEGSHKGWVFNAIQSIARRFYASPAMNMRSVGYEAVCPNVRGINSPDEVFRNASDARARLTHATPLTRSLDLDEARNYEDNVRVLQNWMLDMAAQSAYTHPKFLAFLQEYAANLVFMGSEAYTKALSLAEILHRNWMHDSELALSSCNPTLIFERIQRFMDGWNIFFQNGGVTAVGLTWNGEEEVKFVTYKPTAVVTNTGRVEIRVIVNDLPIPRYFADGSDYRDGLQALKALNSPVHTLLIPAEPELDDLWHHVYENGPSSCMTDYPYERCPVRVYCHEDNSLCLLVTYRAETPIELDDLKELVRNGSGSPMAITGRAVGNMESKQYVRSYGQNTEGHLMNFGFNHNSSCLDGQELRYIEYGNDCVLMPYLDGYEEYVEAITDSKGRSAFRITDSSCDNYEAQSASGYIEIDQDECHECGDRYCEDDLHEVYDDGCAVKVCENCRDRHYVWVDHDNDYHNTNDVTYSEYTGEYILDGEVFDCPLVGIIHEDRVGTCDATGKEVFEDRLVDGILAFEDAVTLGVEDERAAYLNEDEDE